MPLKSRSHFAHATSPFLNRLSRGPLPICSPSIMTPSRQDQVLVPFSNTSLHRLQQLLAMKPEVKGRQLLHGPMDYGSSRFHIIETVEASLRRLQTDHIDVFFMHGQDNHTPVEETLRALDDLVTQGKTRYIGCSNFSGWHLMKSLSVSDRRGWSRYVLNQTYYSLVGREYEWELMPLGLDQGVSSMIWSPLAGGALSAAPT